MKLFYRVLLVALLATSLYGSSLSFTLSPSVEVGRTAPFPVSLDFSGTLTDTDTGGFCDRELTNCLYLNFISFSFDQDTAVSHLSGDPVDFYLANSQFGFLSDGGPFDTFTGNIFGIVVQPDTPLGVYTGSVSIFGGYDDSAANNFLASQSFTVVVAPEPADFGLAITGLAAVLLAKRRVAK